MPSLRGPFETIIDRKDRTADSLSSVYFVLAKLFAQKLHMQVSQAQPHSFLRSLFQQVNDLEADFPSLETLQALGIQAFQVSLDTEKHGTLKLKPCFFEPQPGKGLLQMYPLRPMDLAWDQGDSMKLSPLSSVQGIMDRAAKKYPPKIAPILENLRKEDRFNFDRAHDPDGLASELERVVDAHLRATRVQGPFKYFTLADLKTQETGSE